VTIEYTLDAQDVASARLLAIGVRPRLEFALFAAVLLALLAVSLSSLRLGAMPLPVLIGLTACLAAFRVTQISKVRQAALVTFKRNDTLRQPTAAMWDDGGVTIQPFGGMTERIPWTALRAFKENERIVLFQQKSDVIHAIPKRAFADKAALAALRRKARAMINRKDPETPQR
jgi:YcxB-like protein